MSHMTTAIVFASLSFAGFGVVAMTPKPVDPTGIDWKDMAAGGSSLLMLAALIAFLRFLADERKAQATEREAAAKERLAMTETFSETAVGLTTQFREDVATGRKELHDLVNQIRAHHQLPERP